MRDHLITACVLVYGFVVGSWVAVDAPLLLLLVVTYLQACVAVVCIVTDDRRDTERDYTAELLLEVLEEYGPASCDQDCGCSGCTAYRHLFSLRGAGR